MLNTISHRLPPYRGVVNFIWAQLYTVVNNRLAWEERLARNARAPTTDRPAIKLYGVPEIFATFLGLPTA